MPAVGMPSTSASPGPKLSGGPGLSPAGGSRYGIGPPKPPAGPERITVPENPNAGRVPLWQKRILERSPQMAPHMGLQPGENLTGDEISQRVRAQNVAYNQYANATNIASPQQMQQEAQRRVNDPVSQAASFAKFKASPEGVAMQNRLDSAEQQDQLARQSNTTPQAATAQARPNPPAAAPGLAAANMRGWPVSARRAAQQLGGIPSAENNFMGMSREDRLSALNAAQPHDGLHVDPSQAYASYLAQQRSATPPTDIQSPGFQQLKPPELASSSEAGPVGLTEDDFRTPPAPLLSGQQRPGRPFALPNHSLTERKLLGPEQQSPFMRSMRGPQQESPEDNINELLRSAGPQGLSWDKGAADLDLDTAIDLLATAAIEKQAFGLSEIGEYAKNFGGKALEFAKSNPEIAGALGVGGLGAALGGGHAALSNLGKPEEERHSVLGSALTGGLAGAALGGGAGLAHRGLSHMAGTDKWWNKLQQLAERRGEPGPGPHVNPEASPEAIAQAKARTEELLRDPRRAAAAVQNFGSQATEAIGGGLPVSRVASPMILAGQGGRDVLRRFNTVEHGLSDNPAHFWAGVNELASAKGNADPMTGVARQLRDLPETQRRIVEHAAMPKSYNAAHAPAWLNSMPGFDEAAIQRLKRTGVTAIHGQEAQLSRLPFGKAKVHGRGGWRGALGVAAAVPLIEGGVNAMRGGQAWQEEWNRWNNYLRQHGILQ